MHLKRPVNEYGGYFNEERPHQGINLNIPNRSDTLAIQGYGEIRSIAFLGGLDHSNSRVSGRLQANFVKNSQHRFDNPVLTGVVIIV